MDTLSPENHAATKVLVKACAWADRRLSIRDVEDSEKKRRDIGRFTKSSDELAEAVKAYRNAGGQP